MNTLQTMLRKLPTFRYNLGQPTLSKTVICHKSSKKSPQSSSSSSDSDDESKKKLRNSDAVSRLNTLLQQMVSEDTAKSSISLAKPSNKRVQKRMDKESMTTETVEKQVTSAVKDVAQSLGGDTKQIESELLLKLLNPVENQSGSPKSLSDLLKGMKIEREAKPQSKAEQVRNVLQKYQTDKRPQGKTTEQKRPKQYSTPVFDNMPAQREDLFGGEPLGIFTKPAELKESTQLPTWQKLHEKELKLAVTHPPANYFQEMILWTEQGKFWQFPIDNEFGLEEESKVYFAEHVFLEDHLEPWCPPRGPIRHFMELVCIGLSKNPYLTVEAKKGHIEWFRNYFEDKKKLLQEVGAIQSGETSVEKPKSIE